MKRKFAKLYGFLILAASLGGCASLGPAPSAEGPTASTARFQFDRSGSVASVEATGARFVLFHMSLGERVKKAAATVTTLKAPVTIRLAQTARALDDRVRTSPVREPVHLAQAIFVRSSVTSFVF